MNGRRVRCRRTRQRAPRLDQGPRLAAMVAWPIRATRAPSKHCPRVEGAPLTFCAGRGKTTNNGAVVQRCYGWPSVNGGGNVTERRIHAIFRVRVPGSNTVAATPVAPLRPSWRPVHPTRRNFHITSPPRARGPCASAATRNRYSCVHFNRCVFSTAR